MKSHPATQQIIYAYKELDWSAETISTQLDIDINEVREVISKEVGLKDLLSKTLDNDNDILELLKSLARTAESEKVRADALKYLHAELKGRNDLPKEHLDLKRQKLQLEAVDVGMRLKQFNDALERSNKMKSSVTLPAILPSQTLAEIV